ALLAKRDEEGAVAVYRDAVRLDGPRIGDAVYALGGQLRRMGRYEEATKTYLHARKLALSSKQTAQVKRADREVEETRRWKALSDRVPAIVRGVDRPADPGELLTIGTICAERRLYVGAARLFDNALK